MDRSDERNDTETAEERVGDVLGLSGSSVTKEPGDPTVAEDASSRRKRRVRAQEGEAEQRRDDDPYRQSKGATGIDMGAGGRGTDVSGE